MGYLLKENEFRYNNESLKEFVAKRIQNKKIELQDSIKYIDSLPVNIDFTYREQLENLYYSYSNKITDVLGSKYWAGHRCFILGGGESLKGFNFSILKNELTIGINRIFEVYSPTILYSMDTRFLDWIMMLVLDNFDKTNVYEKFLSNTSIKVFLCPLSYYDFNKTKAKIYVVRRIIDECISLDIEKGIFGGNNSGFGALALAIALGANPIYLLGYDMKIEESTHWHSGYPGQDVNGLKSKLDSYRQLFEKFAPLIQSLGIKVVNLNKNSGLKCFEFDDIENIL